VTVEITNTGPRDGIEVVQLYSRQVAPRVERPARQLQAFARVELPAGRTRTVELELPVSAPAYWCVASGRYRVDPGEYTLMVGRSSTDIRARTRVLVPDGPISARALLGTDVPAVDFDDYERITLVGTTRESGDAVAVTGDGWIVFRAVRLNAPASRITARVARVSASTASLTLRSDDPVTGPLIGALPVDTTGGTYEWATISADIDAPAGTYDLYLVLDGEQRLDWFRLDP
jgi:beta-glucosidase